MTKEQQKQTAYLMFDEGKTRTEIAKSLNITQKTVGNWIRAYKGSILQRQYQRQRELNSLPKQNAKLLDAFLNRLLSDPTVDIKTALSGIKSITYTKSIMCKGN